MAFWKEQLEAERCTDLKPEISEDGVRAYVTVVGKRPAIDALLASEEHRRLVETVRPITYSINEWFE